MKLLIGDNFVEVEDTAVAELEGFLNGLDKDDLDKVKFSGALGDEALLPADFVLFLKAIIAASKEQEIVSIQAVRPKEEKPEETEETEK
jgi:hypothetical protein